MAISRMDPDTQKHKHTHTTHSPYHTNPLTLFINPSNPHNGSWSHHHGPWNQLLCLIHQLTQSVCQKKKYVESNIFCLFYRIFRLLFLYNFNVYSSHKIFTPPFFWDTPSHKKIINFQPTSLIFL